MTAILDELLQPALEEKLLAFADAKAEAYRLSKPFPHIAIDDFLPAGVTTRVEQAFPKPGDLPWRKYFGKHEAKLAFFKAERMPSPIRDVLYFLNSAPMLGFLERLTGIEGLLPDPYFNGGGIHQIERGGHLGVHADFNWMDQISVMRRVNFLLYLNRDWQDSYGGHLQLWDAQMTRCEKKILPVFNRCVVFTSTDDSFHGHPEPLTCPAEMSRRSIATYYYTALRNENAPKPHSTIFKDVPNGRHPARAANGGGFKKTVRRFVPRIVADAYRAMKGQ